MFPAFRRMLAGMHRYKARSVRKGLQEAYSDAMAGRIGGKSQQMASSLGHLVHDPRQMHKVSNWVARFHRGNTPFTPRLGAGVEAIAFDLGSPFLQKQMTSRVARIELSKVALEGITPLARTNVPGLIETEARRAFPSSAFFAKGAPPVDVRIVPKAEKILGDELERGAIDVFRGSDIIGDVSRRVSRGGHSFWDSHTGNIGRVRGRWQALDPGGISQVPVGEHHLSLPRPTQLQLPFGSGHAGLNESVHGRVTGTVSKCTDQRLRLARLTPGVKIPRVAQPGWNLGSRRARASGQGLA